MELQKVTITIISRQQESQLWCVEPIPKKPKKKKRIYTIPLQLSAAHKGLTKSEETRAKMAKAQMGNTNSINQPGSIAVRVSDIRSVGFKEYGSIAAVARVF